MEMKKLSTAAGALSLTAALALVSSPALAGAKVGEAAPAFSLTDSHAKQHNLADFAGKLVVLEWVNYDCPFVAKHYGSGNMQKLQKKYTGKGVVWLSINSSAPGKQGHFAAEKLQALMAEREAAPTAYLLDPEGEVGRSYGAKTTPHMFIVGEDGKVIYAGGIDDKPSTDEADIATATNYVEAALEEALAGKPVTTVTSPPYGCSVKYAD
jgi:peroxiredoxin